MINLFTRLGKGAALTWAELDENFTRIKNAIEGIQGGGKSLTVTLVEGENNINHAIGRKARVVSFFLASGIQTNYEWRRHADDANNRIIVVVPEGTPHDELRETEINIITL